MNSVLESPKPQAKAITAHLSCRQLLAQQLDFGCQLSFVGTIGGTSGSLAGAASGPCGGARSRCHLEARSPLLCLAHRLLQQLHTGLGGGGALLCRGQRVAQLANLRRVGRQGAGEQGQSRS